jgi:ATP-dependent helicase/nuclease subunit A
MLVDRLLALLLEGVVPSKILCLTFTKVAALEMRERLEDRLLAWRRDPALSETLKAEGFRIASAAHARTLFEKTLRTPVRFHTLHSFCQSVLDRFDPVPPRIIEGEEQSQLLERALRGVLEEAKHQPDLQSAFREMALLMDRKSLLEAFQEILRARSALEVLGQSSFQDLKVRYAAAFNLDPETFGREVSIPSTLPEKISALCPLLAEGTKTEQKQAQGLRKWLEAPESPETFSLLLVPFLTQDGTIRARLGSQELRKRHPSCGPLLEETANAVQDLFRERQRRDGAFKQCSCAYFLEALFSAYTRLKERERGLDFDDLISKTHQLISTQGAEAVLCALDEGIDHILLDEAQDTSKEQWEVLLALSAEFLCHEDPTRPARSFCVVGDRKQSIYSFQGASSACFDAVRDYYLASSDRWKQYALETSFRSTPIVLTSVDQTFRDPDQTPGVCPRKKTCHIAHRKEVPGVFELWPVMEGAEKPSLPEPWTIPESVPPSPTPEEKLAQVIASSIQRLLRDNTPVPSCGRTARPEDFLVLMQRRGSLMAALVRALQAQGIPTAGTDHLVLHDHILFEDCLAAAQFFLYPEDSLTLATVLKGPFVGWTEGELFDACRSWKGSSCSLWEHIRREHPSLQALFEEWIACARLLSPYVFFASLLYDPSINARLLRATRPEGQELLQAFLEAAWTFEKEHSLSLERFVAHLRAHPVVVKRETNARSGVRLMTVHGAKGLQAPFVILADASTVYERVPTFAWSVEGLLFWISNPALRMGPAEDLYREAHRANEEESQRLLYVAMTRAQDALYVTGVKKQRPVSEKSWYQLIKTQLSPFLEERVDTLWPAPRLVFPQNSLGPQKTAEIVLPVMAPHLPSWLLSPVVQAGPEQASIQEEGTDYARGLAIHQLLEELPCTPAALWGEKGHMLLKKYALEQAEEILEEAINVLTSYSFLFTEPAPSEASFFLPERGVGRIDRLHITEDALWVVDFKTDRHIPEVPERIPESYKTQLRFYANLFLSSAKPVQCALLWTAAPLLMEIPLSCLFPHAQEEFSPPAPSFSRSSP